MDLRTLLAALTLATLAPAALGAESSGIPYSLGPDALFEAGCLPPCMCPVLLRSGLSGTFRLVPGTPDESVTRYEVRDVAWRLGKASPVTVTGEGAYELGGEPLRQRLVLDLRVGDAQPRRYDSGWVGGAENFPRLSLPVALNGFFCHDSVYGVQADPQLASAIPTARGGVALRAAPNPFAGRTWIDFRVPVAGAVELTVLDVAGRQVRGLLRGQRFEAGTYAMAWDGADDDGRRAPSGVYFVSLRAGGREERGRLVRF